VIREGLRSTRPLALTLLVVVAAIGFQPFFLQALRIDGAVARKQYDELPYRRIAGLQQTCENVRRLVPRGARIAFGTPYPGWWEGYSFSYMRASYLLAEYRLLPLLDAQNQPQREILEDVDWALILGEESPPGFERVAVAGQVSLLRKVR
jgi:hypothetical protein